VDKPANPNSTMFPACWNCRDRIIQTDWVDPKNFDYIAGCLDLRTFEWDKGVKKDASGTVYQSNCPLAQRVLGRKP